MASKMNWNDQQLAVFTHGEGNKGSLIVKARAGTGKTTTAVEYANRVSVRTSTRSGRRVFLGAFNKSIADELVTRVAHNPLCTASTFHSIGYRLWREMRQRSRIDSHKVSTLARERYPYDKKVRSAISDAVGFAKLDGLGLDGMPAFTDHDAWVELFDAHDIWDDIPAGISDERVINDCITVFKKSLDMVESNMDSVIDFDDMLYAPLYFGSWKPQRFDTVIMDEAQDTNETRLRLAKSILVDGGSFVAFGDPAQAIYQFAGAAIGAMDKIREATNADVLPLSITYRCPKAIVAAVNTHVPDYAAGPDNAEGKIESIPHTDFWRLANRLNGANDAILCRNTRPLVGIAKRLRSEGIPCVVEGNNGKAILALLAKWGTNLTWGQYLTRLTDHTNKEVKKLLAKEKEADAERLREKMATILDIADDPEPNTQMSDIINRAEWLFGKGKEGDVNILRLCTIHRSKGREWERVVLIGENRYMPSAYAKTEADLEAEANLRYVAYTRTKRTLVLVTVPVPGPGQKEEQDWWEL